MVRKAAIWLGVGATVAVGGVGYVVYQLKRYASHKLKSGGRKSIATSNKEENLDVASVPVDEAIPLVSAPATRGVEAADVTAPADPVAAILHGNEVLLGEKERALVAQLLELDQGHLFEGWPEPGIDDDNKRRLLAQLLVLDSSYHGGLAAYIGNARKLLQESRDGVNPFEGYVPSVPSGSRLDFASPQFMELEGEGLQEAGAAAFVLVAGGLGERLGYSGIKVALPSESATGTPFLGLYISSILALQARAEAGRRLPLAIMTSDDTHGRTVELLQHNKYFGMEEDQVILLKQEKVACLTDNAAHLGLEPGDRWALQTKPHGHGDVHMLLASSGLARSWLEQGFKWVCFFQDTNALVFRALLAALGVSARHQYDMNSLAVPRRAKEAIGAISRLTRPDGSAPLTINVEYNQLDPLLRATISPQGDVNDETGFSPFPGNINQLVLKLSSYVPQLAATGGVISEFVNPKYKDATKTAFKSSTRLECMMQDYPKALPSTANIGFTTINQVWASYSPVKNSPADAAAKFKEGNPTHSATTGELDIYKANCLSLHEVAGVALPEPLEAATFNSIHTEVYPRVVLTPAFAPTLAEVKAKVAPGSIQLTPGSVLVLDGPDILVQGPLEVHGALVVRAVPGAKVTLGPLKVENAGWSWEPLAEGQQATEEERIRGFRVVRRETKELVYDKPGSYTAADEPAPQPESAAPAPEPQNAVVDSEPVEAASDAAPVEAAPVEAAPVEAASDAAPVEAAAEAVPEVAPEAAVPDPEPAAAAPVPVVEAAAAQQTPEVLAPSTETAVISPVLDPEAAAPAPVPEPAEARSSAAESASAPATAAEPAASPAPKPETAAPVAGPSPAAAAPAAPVAASSSSGLSANAKPFVPGAFVARTSAGGAGVSGSGAVAPAASGAPSAPNGGGAAKPAAAPAPTGGSSSGQGKKKKHKSKAAAGSNAV